MGTNYLVLIVTVYEKKYFKCINFMSVKNSFYEFAKVSVREKKNSR